MSDLNLILKRLGLDQMAAAARMYRIAYDERFPFLAGRHTPDDDLRYFRDAVFPAEQVWGALRGGQLLGIVSFRAGWVEKLYVLPGHQGLGIGRRLLAIPKQRNRQLQLWTFRSNAPARRFYEAQGFAVTLEREGSETEEGEAVVLYAWPRASFLTTSST